MEKYEKKTLENHIEQAEVMNQRSEMNAARAFRRVVLFAIKIWLKNKF